MTATTLLPCPTAPSLRETAFAEIEAVVGREHLLTDGASRDRYSRDTIPWDKRCRAVVFPGSAHEVARVIQIASRHRIPVWPFSKGKNWGYGATMASENGAIIMVLERMNRILEVNEELGFAVIEPGVTQQQLYEHLRDSGSRFWMDCTDSTPQASVLGNALERGVGYTTYGDHYGALCGLDVVLSDGSLLQTGGGDEKTKTRHTHKYGIGPIAEGLFSQSNFGVVTRGGIWLMPRPEKFCTFFVRVKREESLPHVITAMREMALHGHVNCNNHLVNDFFCSTLMERFPVESGRQCLSPEQREDRRRRLFLTPWTMSGAVYGSREKVRRGLREVRRRIGRHGTVIAIDERRAVLLRRVLDFAESRPSFPRWPARLRGLVAMGRAAAGLYPVYKGEPIEMFVDRVEYFKAPVRGPGRDVDPCRDGNGTGLIWFPPLSPLQPECIGEVLAVSRRLFARFGFDHSCAVVLINPRTAIVLTQIHYRKDCPRETAAARALHAELVEACTRRGYPQYRASAAQMDRILEGNPVYRQFLARLKKAIDPADVIAPGRYGVKGSPESAGDEKPSSGESL